VTLRSLSPRVQSALAIIALLGVAMLGYVLLIAPKRSAAAELEGRIDDTQAEIDERRAKAGGKATPASLDVAELFRATKAMPDEAGMPELILELNRLASDSGVSFQSISPGPPVAGTGYEAVPLTLVADGTYSGMSSFLARIRRLVRFDGDKLKASGRLLAVESVSLAQNTEQFPKIQATVTVNALVYGGGPSSEGSETGAAGATGGES
jgi:Tfp pilus assembly protein PilO